MTWETSIGIAKSATVENETDAHTKLKDLQKLNDIVNLNSTEISVIAEWLGVEFIDMRNLGGVFWIIGGQELTPTIEKLRELGFAFLFKEGSGHTNEHRDAWWCSTSSVQEEPATLPTQAEQDKPLFKKNVDLSLLKYGFAIPQSAVVAFCSNISVEVPRGGNFRISLKIIGTTYPVTLRNVGFASKNRLQWQVRYSQSSPIANVLKSIFAASFDLLAMGKQPENKEYIEVVGISPDVFVLICHPSNSMSTTKSENDVADNTANSDLKIGAYIQEKMGQLSNSGFAFSEQQLQKICDLQWGKAVFKLATPHPFAKIVDGAVDVSELLKDKYGYNRYWNQVFSFGKVNLIFISQWYERNRVYFDKWFLSLNVGLSSSIASPLPTASSVINSRSHRITIKAAIIEYSNTYVGKFKTRKEICDELTAKYRFPTQSIFPADYEVNLSNSLPKLFRRIDHGTYECLGYGDDSMTFYRSLTAMHYTLGEADQKRAKHIIASKFKSGYRTASGIDFERFKNYYANEYGEEFESDNNSLDMLMKSVAVIFDDRAYMYDDETVESVRAYLEQMDSPCFYIDAFFEKFSGELYTFGIFSVDMFKAFIEKNYTGVFCKRDYVYLQPDASPFDLIRQVFDERETWSFDELFARLPWLKQDTIRATLNGSDYHRIETGVYTHVDNMDLPDSEGKKTVAFVREQLQSKDYVIANELDLSQFESLNPHCPFLAIRDAVFNKFLSNRYSKSGQVITHIGEKLRIIDILEQYCREAETASFKELNTFEATFNPDGRTHSACLVAAHNVMARVSSDLFVAESKVSFDVERTDEVIALYCKDNFIPLKNVVDFSLFPYAGYSWNLFLLESYVRKFSRMFEYDVRAVNSANIGVIVRKSFIYGEYDDILALALVKSPLSLNNKKAVGDYLFDNGYIGRRNLGKSESKILAAAKKLREGGVV